MACISASSPAQNARAALPLAPRPSIDLPIQLPACPPLSPLDLSFLRSRVRPRGGDGSSLVRPHPRGREAPGGREQPASDARTYALPPPSPAAATALFMMPYSLLLPLTPLPMRIAVVMSKSLKKIAPGPRGSRDVSYSQTLHDSTEIFLRKTLASKFFFLVHSKEGHPKGNRCF